MTGSGCTTTRSSWRSPAMTATSCSISSRAGIGCARRRARPERGSGRGGAGHPDRVGVLWRSPRGPARRRGPPGRPARRQQRLRPRPGPATTSARDWPACWPPMGSLTLEFPHLVRLIEDSQFDTIYHEHFSYFTLRTASAVLAAHGLRVFDVEELSTHGGSLRLFAAHAASDDHPTMPSVDALLERERAGRLPRAEPATSRSRSGSRSVKRDLLAFLIDARRAGKTVVGYGAPGKGNTLLNYCGIRTDLVDFTVDRNPYKHGRFTPGTHMPDPPAGAAARGAARLRAASCPGTCGRRSPRSWPGSANGAAPSWCPSPRSRSSEGEGRPVLRRPRPPPARTLGEHPQAHGADRLPADPVARDALLRALRACATSSCCLGYKADVIKDYFLRYNEALSNDFVLSGAGRDVQLLRSDIDDWRISFVDTGLHANLGQRLRAVQRAPRRRGGLPRELRRRADRCATGPSSSRPSSGSGKIAAFLAVQPTTYSFHLVHMRPDGDGLVERIEDVRTLGPVDQRRLLHVPTRDLRLHPAGRGARRGAVPAADRRRPADGLSSTTGFWAPMDTLKDVQNLESMYEGGRPPWAVWQPDANGDG